MKNHNHFKGSGIRFGKIVFSRRYHPPIRFRKGMDNIGGQWNWKTKEITVFLAGLKKAGYNFDDILTHEEMIRLFNHEVLHGVIDSILWQDKIDEDGINEHWPHENGMEYDSSLAEKQVN